MATDVARLSLAIDVTGAKRAQSAMEALQSGSVRLTRATDEQIAAQLRLNSTYNRQSAPAVSRFRRGLTALRQSFVLQKGATQQAGFQIQDFTTQIAAGQSATVAFGQQASQLAGILGPGGAVLGAVVAIGAAITGVFINSMGGASESTETLTEKTRDLVRELGRATERQREFINTGFQQEILEEERRVQKARDTIVEMNARLEDFRRAAGDNVPDAVFNSNSAVKSLRQNIEDARLVIDNATLSTDKIAKKQKEFWEKVEEAGKKTGDTTDKIKEMVEAAEQQAATIGLSARATATYEAALAGANAEQILAIDQAYRLIEARNEQARQAKEAAQQEQALAKMRAQADPAMAEFNRYADQIDQIEQFNITAAEKERLREVAFRQHQDRMSEIARSGTSNVVDISGEANTQIIEQQRQLDMQIVSTFGNAIGAIKGFTEQGTAEWAAMVLAQKGIMASQAIMAANLAATLALANPMIGVAPEVVAARAETIRQLGYVNAGLILAQGVGEIAASFDGGGYTGNGPRSGGLDGKGGFMAMMHPQETVIDHSRGQGMGGDMTVIINNAPQGSRVEQRRDSQGNQVAEVFIADMANGGPMSKTVQSTFGLKRQGR